MRYDSCSVYDDEVKSLLAVVRINRLILDRDLGLCPAILFLSFSANRIK